MSLALPVSLEGQRTPVAGKDDFPALLKNGFALHERAEYGSAIPVLKHALALYPQDYFANLLLGIDLLRTGRADESVAFLQKASSLKPKEEIPLAYLGEAQAHAGHFTDAALAYERAVEVAPHSSQAVESSLSYAVDRFRKLSEELRSTSQGLAADYRLQAMTHRVDDPTRERLLQESGSIDPNSPGIWGDLAIVSMVRGRRTQAQEYVALAMTQDSNDLRAIEADAMISASLGDWTLAFQKLNTIGARSPGVLSRAVVEWPPVLTPQVEVSASGAAANFFTCVRNASKTCEFSSFALRRALLNPANLYREQRWEELAGLASPAKKDVKAWFARGVAFTYLGQWNKAIPALERSLTDGTAKPYARALLCWSYAQEAEREMLLLQQEQGDPAALHSIRGDLLEMQGAKRAAIAEYTLALQSRSDDPALLEKLAEAQFRDGQPELAVKNARAALSIDPLRFAAMETIARVAIEQRRYQDALPSLLELNTHEPNNPAVQVELGSVLAQTGDLNGAVQHLEPALADGYPDQRGNLHAVLGTALRKLNREAESAKAFATSRELSERYQSSPQGSSNVHP